MSKTRRRSALKRLMRTPLPEDKHIDALLQLAGPLAQQNPEYDRMAAIVGATFVEHSLRRAIKRHFKPDASDPEYNYLFHQDDAPYRDFSSLNRLAPALGIVTVEQYEHLESIRHIRNVFAHAMDRDLTFDSEGIAEACESLPEVTISPYNAIFAPRNLLYPKIITRRHKFVHAVFMYYWGLRARLKSRPG